AAPLERVIVHGLGGKAVMAVALHLVAERTHHLAVTVVAALPYIDVAARQLQRGVGAHALDLLDRVLHPEERHDLHDAADDDGDEGEDREQRDVAFDLLVLLRDACHAPYSAATGARGRSAASS